MRTPKQRSNLRRGPGSREAAAHARQAKAKAAERDRELAAIAERDPVEALTVLLREQASAVLTLLRSWTARGGDPSPRVIEAVRETRALAEAVRARGGDRSADREAAAFLGEIARRIEPSGLLGGGPAQDFPSDVADGDAGPREILGRLYAELQAAALRASRRWTQTGSEPSRAALAASREFRQLAEVVLDLGAASAFDPSFLDSVEERARILVKSLAALSNERRVVPLAKRPSG